MRCKTPLLLTTTMALLLSACSAEKSEQAASSSDSAAPAAASAERADQAGPAISGAVAPGVAFAYNYSFILPAGNPADSG